MMDGLILTNASAIDRNSTDFYPTPGDVTRVISDYMSLSGKRVWEPACGAGHMVDELESNGALVVATELNYQGCGIGGVDFLEAEIPNGIDVIVTNPPFKLAEQFIRRAIHHGIPFAMLLKSQYWHSSKRKALFDLKKPEAVLPLTWRPDFHFGSKGGSPTMEVIWTVWGEFSADQTKYQPQIRPRKA